MTVASYASGSPDATMGSIRYQVAYLALTFGITWGLGLLFVTETDFVESLFGPLTSRNPLFYLAVYAPAIAAVIVVLHAAGVRGLNLFLRRILIWRVGIQWYLFIFMVPAIATLLGALLFRMFEGKPPEISVEGSWPMVLFAALALGPIEELGWRGYLLPVLQRRMSALAAALAVGVVWGVWHLPAFFLGDLPQGAWSLAPYLVALVAVSVIFTALFNGTRGSILTAGLLHWQLNNPLYPDVQPYDAPAFVLMALAVWFAGRRWFMPARQHTGIIGDERREGGSIQAG